MARCYSLPRSITPGPYEGEPYSEKRKSQDWCTGWTDGFDFACRHVTTEMVSWLRGFHKGWAARNESLSKADIARDRKFAAGFLFALTEQGRPQRNGAWRIGYEFGKKWNKKDA